MSSILGPPSPDKRERMYYSITEAAKLIGVSRVTIWRWIREGKLPASRLGHRTVRIKREDLDRLAVRAAVIGPHPEPDPRAGAAGGPEHVVRFYGSDDSLMDAVAEYIGEGLRAGGAGLIIVTEDHRTGIEERLLAAGFDPAAARRDGRYLSLNAAETLLRIMDDGEPDAERVAEVGRDFVERASRSGRHVRVFGEMVALLVKQGNDAAALRLEGLWSVMQRRHGWSLMCGYPMGGFPGEEQARLFDEVCALHTRVIPAESYAAASDLDEQLRAVADMQRRTQALEAEIAELRRADEHLQQSLAAERRAVEELRDILESAPVGLAWVGPDGTIVWANRAEMESLGYQPEQYIGHHIGEFYADRGTVDDILARLSRGEPVSEYLARRRCQDGSIRYVLVDASVQREDGRFVHSRIFTRDATEFHSAEGERARLLERERTARREAQWAALRTQRLQEITSQLSQSLEAEEVLTTIARSAADLLQVQVGAVFLLEQGKPDADFELAAAHGIDEERARGLVLPRGASLAGRAIDEGRTLVVDDVYGTAGTALPQLLTGQATGSEIAAPITAGAEQLGVIKAFSPVVQRFDADDAAVLTALAAAAAAALTNARLYREAQHAVQVRDDFLATAAHDLKTPITAIKATAQLLRRRLARAGGAAIEGLAEGLASIDETSTTMARQLDDLVDLTRLQVGRQVELHLSQVDLVALVGRVAAEQQRLTKRHRIQVEARVDALIGAWDEVRLGRVLDNLLSNAIKYSPHGGDIVVSLSREADAGVEWAVLAVRDHGLGIPAADLSRIFERYGRAANVAGRIAGTGLGLASARQLVEQHGGTLSVDSREGEGSTFTVRLPLAPPAGADVAVDEPAP